MNGILSNGVLSGTRPTVAVILVNYNGGPFLVGLVDSLKSQTFTDFEVTVVDNGSTDGSAEEFRARLPDCRLFLLGRNTGFAYANNLGIRRSRSQFVLLLNVDVVLESTFLEEIVGALRRRPDVGWAAPAMNRLIDHRPSDQIDRYGHHMQRDRKTGPDGSKPFVQEAYQEEEVIFGASGCAVLYRREMLEDIAVDGEYFDEDFFAYYEDIDLDWRGQIRGWKCLFVPTARGYHAGGGSGLRRQRRIAASELTNRLFMMIKNDQLPHVVRDLAPILGETVWEVARFSWRDPVVPVLAAARFLRLFPAMVRKRKKVHRMMRVSPEYLRGLIRHPPNWTRRWR